MKQHPDSTTLGNNANGMYAPTKKPAALEKIAIIEAKVGSRLINEQMKIVKKVEAKQATINIT